MGKIRIIQQYGRYEVQEEATGYQYNDPFQYWKTISIGGYKEDAQFKNLADAEEFAEKYINALEEKKVKVIKEYNYD